MHPTLESLDELLRELTGEQAGEQPSAPEEDSDIDALVAILSVEGEQKKPGAQPETKAAPAQERKTPPKKSPAPKKPVKQELPPAFLNDKPQSPPMQIDIEKIRAEQPPVKPIPAQNFAEEPEQAPPKSQPEAEPHLRPADKVRERTAVAEEQEREAAPRIAPAFRRLEQKIGDETAANQMAALREAGARASMMAFVLLLLAAMMTGMAVFLHIQRVQFPDQIPSRITLGILTALGAVAGGVSWPVLQSGLGSLVRLEPNRELPAALTYLVCLLQSVGQLLFPRGLLNSNIQFYIPVGALLLAAAWQSRALTLKTASLNAKFVSADYEKFSPQTVPDTRLASDLTRGLVEGYGVPVINRRTDLLSGFLPISLGSDRSDTIGRNLAVAGLIAGAAAGLFTFLFTQHKNLALTVMTACMLVFSPLSCLFFTAYPLRRGAKFANRAGGLAAGERSTADCAEANAVVIDAKDLFPPSGVTLSGIKTCEGMRIDEAILDAASVLVQSGSILSNVFLKMIGNRTELLRKAESVSYEDGMGLSAWVGKKRVLIGGRELLLQHGIRVPSEDYERRFAEQGCDLVYFASAGELTAVFVITLRPSREADNAIQMLLENDILLTVKTVDPIVTREKLGALYLCDPSCFKILPSRLFEAVEERRALVKVKPASLANNGSFGSLAAALVVSRRMKVMMTAGSVIETVSLILGAGLVLMLALLGAMVQLSAPVMAGYLLLWLAVGLLIQRLVRI